MVAVVKMTMSMMMVGRVQQWCRLRLCDPSVVVTRSHSPLLPSQEAPAVWPRRKSAQQTPVVQQTLVDGWSMLHAPLVLYVRLATRVSQPTSPWHLSQSPQFSQGLD